MRIIGGELRGRTVKVPGSFRGRPTTDFAREGLFNMLENLNAVASSRVLELFAGTGVFSIECLSRGARSATAVEVQTAHVIGIKSNLDHFGLTSGSVFRSDVMKWIEKDPGVYDLIFADPPFDLKALDQLPGRLMGSGLLDQQGLFILEHPSGHSFTETPGFERTRAFGNVHFTFFRHSQS